MVRRNDRVNCICDLLFDLALRVSACVSPRRSRHCTLVRIWIFLCWTFAFASPVLCLSSKIYLLSSFHFKISYNIYTPLDIPEKQVELHPSSQNLVTTQISSLDHVLHLSPSVSRIS